MIGSKLGEGELFCLLPELDECLQLVVVIIFGGGSSPLTFLIFMILGKIGGEAAGEELVGIGNSLADDELKGVSELGIATPTRNFIKSDLFTLADQVVVG